MKYDVNIIDKIITSQIEIFRVNFGAVAHSLFYDEKSNAIIHPGEFGMLRESVVCDLLVGFLPEAFGVSDGFIVSPDGSVSSQCDVIIYSKQHCPKIETAERQRFYPIESVVAVGEVKSVIDASILRSALVKLSEIKGMRGKLSGASVAWSVSRDIGPYDARANHLDQIGTFIICDSMSCSKKTVTSVFKEASTGSNPTLSLNMLIGIKDYLVNYRDNSGKAWMYPVDVDSRRQVIDSPLPLVFVMPGAGGADHLKIFLRYLEIIVTRTSILNPEFTKYFKLDKIVTVDESDI